MRNIKNDMSDITLIVLIAGKSTRMYPLTYGIPKCLLSVFQKPAIFNMLMTFIQRGVRRVVFVVNSCNKDIVSEFLEKALGNMDIDIEYKIQDKPTGPLDAFRMASEYINQKTLLLLGDTICDTDFDVSEDFIGSYEITDNSHSQWCMIRKNKEGKLDSLIDKPIEAIDSNEAVIGIYLFNDANLLNELLRLDYEYVHEESQLSSLILEYNKRRPIKIVKMKKWYDVGTLKNYGKCNTEMINSRYFNSFVVSSLGVIEKKSTFDGIKAEMKWYQEISNTKMKKYLPQIYEYKYDQNAYEFEYIDLSNLSEYYIYYPMPEKTYSFIFDRILDIMDELKNCMPRVVVSADIKEYAKAIYRDKTLHRIDKWERKDLVFAEKIIINGKEMYSFNKAFELLSKRIARIICDSNENFGVIHGDLNFSNILYSPRTSIFKFIDPRGEFGQQSVYGDVRYDYAKLRHSYHGRYEMIINDLFDIEEKCEDTKKSEVKCMSINYKTYTKNDVIDACIKEMDRVMISRGINIDDIELIEGLLFISMISLHSDYPKRQLAFYAIGLECLNNQIRKLGDEI